MGRSVAICLLAAGCYAPAIDPSVPCETACPGQLVCIDRVCRPRGFVPDAQSAGPPGDRDGDGIPDALDNCPDLVNPDQHDEDGDRLGDLCDPCPHLAGDAADRDGDGVGDACDPEPDLARQRIRLFDPFTHLDPAWSLAPAFAVGGDHLTAAAAGSAAGGDIAITTSALRIVTGGTITTVGAMYPHQLTIEFGSDAGSTTYHYVELYDTMASGAVKITQATGTSYPSLASTPYPPPVAAGAWSMQVDESVPAHAIALAGTLGGAPFAPLMAPAPALVSGARISMYVDHLDITFDYFLVIETLP